jgi:hypothetical protein
MCRKIWRKQKGIFWGMDKIVFKRFKSFNKFRMLLRRVNCFEIDLLKNNFIC